MEKEVLEFRLFCINNRELVIKMCKYILKNKKFIIKSLNIKEIISKSIKKIFPRLFELFKKNGNYLNKFDLINTIVIVENEILKLNNN